MKITASNQGTTALTLLEVMAAIFAATILLLIIVLPMLKNQAIFVSCGSGLRAGGFAFRLWANDHNDKFPMELSTNVGGAKEPLMQGSVSAVFRVMSNELCNPRILICPADGRTWATNFIHFNDSNISYFIGIDASDNTNFSDASMTNFLFGDRNLTNGAGMDNHILQLSAAQPGGWTGELHKNRGNVCLADGEVLKLNNSSLRSAVQTTGLATNRLAIP